MARIAQRSASPAKTKRSSSREAAIASPPDWIEPQLCKLVERAPSGDGWVHEIKLDGYRMAARIDRGDVQLLTRSGLDWTEKYPETAEALAKLPVTSAYIDGELCGVGADGVTSFALMQSASDTGTGALVYFAFDLLALDGAPIARLPLLQRKARLADILKKPPPGVAYSEHNDSPGEAVREAACKLGLEGHCFEANRLAIFARQSGHLGQEQMPQPGRVRHRRLDRSRRLAQLHRRVAARLLRERPAQICGPRRDRLLRKDASDAAWQACTAGDRQDAPGGRTATQDPLWRDAVALKGALGAAKAMSPKLPT